MKKVLCLFVVGISVLNSNAQNQPVKSFSGIHTSLDTFSYAVGMNFANYCQQQGITDLNFAAMVQAFDDIYNKKNVLLTNEQANMSVQIKLQEYREQKAKLAKEAGASFLSKNKVKPGVKTLPSGLQYQVIKAGDPKGLKPAAIDTVVVDYVGTLIDGTEFDNSLKRGEPAKFPLNGVIAGWTEILQYMTVGSKWKVFIPYELAYGEGGAGATIPPYSTLIFEINLREIKPATVK